MTPQYRSIAGRLRRSIAAGTLKAGDRVISARHLAQREAVSVPTAIAALRVLEAEGLIAARPRSGYFVCGEAAPTPQRSEPLTSPQSVNLSSLMRAVYDQTGRVSTPLAAAFPDAEWLPRQAMQRSLQNAARRLGREAHTYSSPPGRADLRRQIALHAAAWGAHFAADELVITAGETQAMRLALQATCRRGDLVAIESPSYFGSLLLLESLGLQAIEVPTDPQTGIALNELERVICNYAITAVVVCPTAQNPLGATMPLHARRKLVALLARRNIPLIEDDVYGDLDDPRPPACKAFDETGNVLYCSSVSKTLAPGWRVGWIAAGRYHPQVLQTRWEESLAGSPLFEAALADMLASGEYRRHLQRLRPRLTAAVRAIAARVAASFPADTRIARPPSGYLLWIELPPQVDALVLQRRALSEGISVAPGQLFSPSHCFTHHLRLNCANRVTPRLLHAIDRLGQLCKSR